MLRIVPGFERRVCQIAPLSPRVVTKSFFEAKALLLAVAHVGLTTTPCAFTILSVALD